MKTLKIEQTLNLDQLLESGLLHKQYDNFGMLHIINQKIDTFKSFHDGPTTFYIVKADAEHNYGLDFIIYQRYMADGINFFSKVSHTSCLTNAPFKTVFSPIFINEQSFVDKMIVAGLLTREASETITISNNCYSRDNKARAYFRKHSDIYTVATGI